MKSILKLVAAIVIAYAFTVFCVPLILAWEAYREEMQ